MEEGPHIPQVPENREASTKKSSIFILAVSSSIWAHISGHLPTSLCVLIRTIHSSTHPFIHSSICPSVHPFIHSFIHPSIHLSFHSFIHPFIHLFPFILHHSFHSFIYHSIHRSIHSFIQILNIYFFLLSLIYSSLCSLICSFNHSFVHSLILICVDFLFEKYSFVGLWVLISFLFFFSLSLPSFLLFC